MEPDPADVLPTTVQVAIERATATCEALGLRGEDVEDEWQYIQDLGDAWLTRLEAVSAMRGCEPITPDVGAAVELACAEAASVTDPHRAIDWLSTFPQIILVALGELP